MTPLLHKWHNTTPVCHQIKPNFRVLQLTQNSPLTLYKHSETTLNPQWHCTPANKSIYEQSMCPIIKSHMVIDTKYTQNKHKNASLNHTTNSQWMSIWVTIIQRCTCESTNYLHQLLETSRNLEHLPTRHSSRYTLQSQHIITSDHSSYSPTPPSPPIDNIWAMMIVWR